MKATTEKNTSSSQGAPARQPFFSKDGEGGFFSEGESEQFFNSSTFASNKPVVQAKLTVGQPNDPYEQEADAVADQVVQRLGNSETVQTKPNTPINTASSFKQNTSSAFDLIEGLQMKEEEDAVMLEDTIQRKPVFESNAPPEDETEGNHEVQMKMKEGSVPHAASIESDLAATKGSGSPLPVGIGQKMESSFSTDFSDVRIHTGSSSVQMSNQLGAQAFTSGNDIHFNEGKFNTSSSSGQHLLAHELTHTIQQGNAASSSDESEEENTSQQLQEQEDSKHKGEQLMQSELAEATQGSNIEAHVEEGKPVILQPTKQPETAEEMSKNTFGFEEVQSSEPDPTEGLNAVQAGDQEKVQVAVKVGEGAGNARAESVINTNQKNSINTLPDTQQNIWASGGDNTEFQQMATPVDPAEFQNNLPHRDLSVQETSEWLTNEKSAAEEREEASALLSELETAAEMHKTALYSAAETQKAAIDAALAIQTSQVMTDLANGSAEISAIYAQGRDMLQQSAIEKKAQLDQQLSQDQQTLIRQSQERTSEYASSLTEKRAAFAAFIDNERQQPNSLAAAEAGRADQELDAAADSATATGESVAGQYSGGDNSDKQREAVRAAAAESGNDIRSKKGSIRQDLMSRTQEVANKYDEFGVTINQRIDEANNTIMPALEEALQQMIPQLQQMNDAAKNAIDQRLAVDLQTLSQAENLALQNLRTAANQISEQIRETARRNNVEIDEIIVTVNQNIDNTVAEAGSTVSGNPLVYLPGIQEVIAQAQSVIAQAKEEGVNSLEQITVTGSENMNSQAGSFNNILQESASGAQQSIHQLQASQENAFSSIIDGYTQQAAGIGEALGIQQGQMITEMIAEIDHAVAEARTKAQSVTIQFAADIQKAADDAIEEAKKPLTDPLVRRLLEIAQRADEPWWMGALLALGDILVGFVILVLVALVVAVIAAAIGVTLTAWGAIMIAGAILLAAGLVLAIINRASQSQLGGNPGLIFLVAVADVTGITGIIELISGKDMVTREVLSAGERTERGTLGLFQLVTLIAGGMSLRGGSFRAPTSLPSFWGRLTFTTGEIGRGFSNMPRGIAEGIRNFGRWVGRKFGRGELPPETRGTTPPDQVDPNQPPPDQVDPNQTPPEQTPPEQTPPEQTPPEQTPPEQTPPEQTPPEQTPPEQTPPEQTPPEQTPPEQTPPEQTPPEQTPPEQTPPEQTPPEQTPPEQTPPEQTPPEQTPPEQTPPEQTPPEQTPPEQTPPEQTPPEQTPPEQTPPEKIPPERWEVPCFIAGTRILTSSGYEPIEGVTTMHKVTGKLAGANDSVGLFQVIETRTGLTSHVVKISIGDDFVLATLHHRFSVPGKGWVMACNLKEDDLLEGINEDVRIDKIQSIEYGAKVNTYNFSVETVHTYFILIGKSPVLVHNDNPVYNATDPVWFYDDAMKARPSDTDGMSVWKASGKAKINEFFEIRVSDMTGRMSLESALKKPHAWLTPENIAANDLVLVPTRGRGSHANAGFEHYSIRLAEGNNVLDANGEPPALSAEEIVTLNNRLAAARKSFVKGGIKQSVEPRKLNS